MQEWSTPAVLQVNRGGQLSLRRTQGLHHRMRRYLRGTLMWTVPIPLVAIVGAFVGTATEGEPG
jgi:hypothetical protein